MICSVCKSDIPEGVKFCPKCGAKLDSLINFHEEYSISALLNYGFNTLKSNFIPSFVVTVIILLSVIFQNIKDALLLSSLLVIISDYYLTRFSLAIPEGRFRLDKSILKMSSGNFWRFFSTELIYSFIIGIGLSLLVIPGIYFIVRLRFWNFALIDKKFSIFDSLKFSWEITKGHSMDVFKWLLTVEIINIVGVLFLLIGIVISYPVSKYGDYLLYKKLSYGAKL